MDKRNLDSMFLLGWNVWTGHSPSDVRKVIDSVFLQNDVEAAVLMEASRLFGHLDDLGYQVIQLKPHPLVKGNIPNNSEVAVLVRNDLRIKKRRTLRMTQFWKGPKHGKRQDPRLYHDVRIKRGRRIIKIGGAHVPFGAAARLETQNRLVSWARNTIKRRPLILILDANMRLPEFRLNIAGPAGMKADGENIDLTAYRNVRLISKKNLGKHGSDHPVMLYEYDLS